jgi:hypothetical protein
MAFRLGDVLRSRPGVLERRDRCPSGKTVFWTKGAASTELRRINATQRTDMQAYRCGYCSYWHLGHRRGAVL